MLHAGLDLSRRKIDVCLLSEQGEHLDQLAVPPDVDSLRTLAQRIDEVHREPVCAVVESMTGARLVHDTLEAEGWDVEIADAQRAKGLAPLACKTDKTDPFVAGARESWRVSLDTVRVVQGEWRGWRPSTDGVVPLAPDEPLAVMTYGKLRARYLPTFTWNNRKVVREVAGNPGLVMRIGLADHPMVRCTFSLWRSEADVVRFAYGAGVHDPIQRRPLDVPWGGGWLFARFRPIASSGTWDGRDPLAELRL